jgi:hypothetical protein
VLDGEFGQMISDKMEPHGLVNLAFWENGFRNLTNSVRPVTRLEDLEGMRVRVMQNDIFLDTFSTLGTNAMPMAFGEVFTALETGTIDAQENPYVTIDTSQFHEVQDYLTETRHAYTPFMVLFSKPIFDTYSAEEQQILRDCAMEGQAAQRPASRDCPSSRSPACRRRDEFNQLDTAEMERIREAWPVSTRSTPRPSGATWSTASSRAGRDPLGRLTSPLRRAPARARPFRPEPLNDITGLPARHHPGRPISRGAGHRLMLAGMFLFSLNDAIGKWLVATYSVGQVLLIRSAMALLVLAPFLWHWGLRSLAEVERPRTQVARVVFSTGEVICFYWAVTYLPLADVMTFWMAAPLCVAATAPSCWASMWACGAGPRPSGFLGVLVALEPFGESPGQGGAVVVALVGMACFAAMMVTGRQLRGTPDTDAGVLADLRVPPGRHPARALGLDSALAAGLRPSGPSRCDRLAGPCLREPRAQACSRSAGCALPVHTTAVGRAAGWLFFGDVPRTAMCLEPQSL